MDMGGRRGAWKEEERRRAGRMEGDERGRWRVLGCGWVWKGGREGGVKGEREGE